MEELLKQFMEQMDKRFEQMESALIKLESVSIISDKPFRSY